MVTVAPGSAAPSLSRTTPYTSPVVCASATGSTSAKQANAVQRIRKRIGFTPSKRTSISRKNRKRRFRQLETSWVRQFARILLSFRPYNVLENFAAARDPEAALLDENLRRPRTEVVVGGHRETVGTSVEDRGQIIFLDRRHRKGAREEITGLANGSDDVGRG